MSRPDRKSLQFELLLAMNINAVQNHHTNKDLRTDCKAFANWAKGEGYKRLAMIDDPRALIQKYEKTLEDKGYTPSTIHRKLHAPCRALGVSMGLIEKPKRTQEAIVRGRRDRTDEAPKRGDKEATQERFGRVVTGARAIGIRRAELGRLTGSDLTRDECGFMAVKVNKGKGGKDTLQRVLPEDERAVKDLFSGVGPTEKVFSRAEMSNHINIHGYRAEKAKRAYAYYSDRLNSEPGYRSQLISELRQRYTTACPGRDPDRWLKKTLTTETYMLRGENKDRAIKLGLPVVYDRLALLAVSVYDLSHWRLSVTVTNYMLA